MTKMCNLFLSCNQVKIHIYLQYYLFGFKVVAFPVNPRAASAGWSRVVALIEGRTITQESRDMTETSTSMSINQPFVQTELFRPSLNYPTSPYAEMLTHTAERYPENEAVLFSAPIRLANDAGASSTACSGKTQ
jgi:hypothetical protein